MGAGRVFSFLKCGCQDHSLGRGLHEDAVLLYVCRGTIYNAFSALFGLFQKPMDREGKVKGGDGKIAKGLFAF